MCRLFGYAGDGVPLSTYLYDATHSLERQSYAPQELIHGSVNVDGTGIAWWQAGEAEPLRYVTAATPWGDANLPTLSRRISASMQIAAVRSATPGLAMGPASVAPYVLDGLAFAHNGRINGFRGPVGRRILDYLPDDLYAEYRVVNDSLALFLLLAAQRRAGASLESATVETLGIVSDVCEAEGATATLNLLVSDGLEIVASRHSVDQPFNSLHTAPGLVASEPLTLADDWVPVPEQHLVKMRPHESPVVSSL